MSDLWEPGPITPLVGTIRHGRSTVRSGLYRPGVQLPRRNITQDGRQVRRYCRRWKIERLFACLQDLRRIVTRYERHHPDAGPKLSGARARRVIVFVMQSSPHGANA